MLPYLAADAPIGAAQKRIGAFLPVALCNALPPGLYRHLEVGGNIEIFYRQQICRAVAEPLHRVKAVA